MKILLLIISTLSLFSERELKKISTEYFAGREGFRCEGDTCYTIDQLSGGNYRIGYSNNQGKVWKNDYEFDPTTQPIISWGVIEFGFTLDRNSQYFLSDYRGGTVFFTNNRGESFKSVNIGYVNNAISDIYMFDTLRGLATAGFNMVHTKDNWITWDSIRSDTILDFRNIQKWTDSTCYLYCVINKGSKNKPTWQRSILEFNINTGDYEVASFLPIDTLYNYNSFFLHFIDDKTGFLNLAAQEGNYVRNIIYRTEDSGKSWDIVLNDIQNFYQLRDIAFSPDRSYGIAIESSYYYETFDMGKTWHQGYFAENPNHTICFVEFAGDRCLIGSWSRGMFAWDEVTSVSLEDIGNLKVWQNGSTFRVGSDIKEIQINIFDLQGNQVSTQHFNKNTIIDLSDKPTGTYFFNIIHQNLIIKSGKLSIIN